MLVQKPTPHKGKIGLDHHLFKLVVIYGQELKVGAVLQHLQALAQPEVDGHGIGRKGAW